MAGSVGGGGSGGEGVVGEFGRGEGVSEGVFEAGEGGLMFTGTSSGPLLGPGRDSNGTVVLLTLVALLRGAGALGIGLPTSEPGGPCISEPAPSVLVKSPS